MSITNVKQLSFFEIEPIALPHKPWPFNSANDEQTKIAILWQKIYSYPLFQEEDDEWHIVNNWKYDVVYEVAYEQCFDYDDALLLVDYYEESNPDEETELTIEIEDAIIKVIRYDELYDLSTQQLCLKHLEMFDEEFKHKGYNYKVLFNNKRKQYELLKKKI